MNQSILTLAPSLVLAVFLSSCTPDNEITFGIVTDVHADMLPDNEERMEKFIDEAEIMNADFIIQQLCTDGHSTSISSILILFGVSSPKLCFEKMITFVM